MNVFTNPNFFLTNKTINYYKQLDNLMFNKIKQTNKKS